MSLGDLKEGEGEVIWSKYGKKIKVLAEETDCHFLLTKPLFY